MSAHPLILCDCCGGSGRRKRSNGSTYRCRACAGVGRRPPPRKSAPPARSASPWGRVPAVATPNASRKWDWAGAARKTAVVNALREARGLPLIPVPQDPTP